MSRTSAVLAARNLSIGIGKLTIVRDVSVQLMAGETLGIVGESGCGKTTLLNALIGYLKPGLAVQSGEVLFGGKDILACPAAEREALRGSGIGFVPQNAAQTLTPTLRIRQHLAEQLTLKTRLPRDRHKARMVELLEAVRLPDPRRILERYPHELSGGQQQRVAIALALAGDPGVLLLDEPTTALDVTTKVFVLDVLRDVAASRQLSMIYVSHDLGVIAHVSHRVVVMYAGDVVEAGAVRPVLKRPQHPYTQGLIASIPRIASDILPRPMPGALPTLTAERTACAFAPRCTRADERCRREVPPPVTAGGGSEVRCFKPGKGEEPRRLARHKTAPGKASGRDVLTLKGVEISYRGSGIISRFLTGTEAARPTVPALDLSVRAGEILSLVGESGSGKSTILKAIAGLRPARRGTILLADVGPLPPAVANRPLSLLRRLQLIFQNPDDSLNPRRSVSEILARPLKLYAGREPRALDARIAAALESVRLNAAYATRRPDQLSGGEKQRVAIARALAADPELLLCDEITSALDVSVQAAVLDLILEVKQTSGKAMIFVSHDLAVVKQISDRVAILFSGEICEIGRTADIFRAPCHPYTKMLLAASLEADPDQPRRPMASDSIDIGPSHSGCAFAGRCPSRIDGICDRQAPDWHRAGPDHLNRCHLEYRQHASRLPRSIQRS